MKIVPFIPKDKQEDQRKADMLEVLDEMKRLIEEGEIEEFVACSSGQGECKVHASCLDLTGGVGLFEIGKHMLMQIELD